MTKKKANEDTIRRMSHKLRILFQVCLYLLPAIPVIYWLGYNHLSPVIQAGVFEGAAPSFLEVNSRAIAFIGSLPAILIMIFALKSLKTLFSYYEKGIYFNEENVKLFRLLGKLAFWSVLADIVQKTFLVLGESINNGPGEKVLAIGISSDHVKLMVVACVIMAIGRVMDEGRKIHDEYQLTV